MNDEYRPTRYQNIYQQGSNQDFYNQSGGYNQPPTLGDRFDWKQLAISLIILAVLGGIIVCSVAFLVGTFISALTNQAGFGLEYCAVGAAISSFVGIVFGALYIPVLGSGNENLFPVAVILIAAVAALTTALQGGLIQGNVSIVVPIVLIAGSAAITIFSMSRIEKAEF